MTIVPWLHPQNFLGAMEAGTAAGERARATDIAHSEAADRLRLAYDSLAAKEEMAGELAKSKQETANAAMQLRAQQAQGLQDYREGLLGAKDKELGIREQRAGDLFDYRNSVLGLQTEKLTQAQKASEALRKARAESDAWKQKVADGTLATRQAEEARKVEADKAKAAGAINWADILKESTPKPSRSLRSFLPGFLGGTPAPDAAQPSGAGASLSGPGASAPTMPSFPAAPKDPKDRKEGQSYQVHTRKVNGIYTWTGKGWETYQAPSDDEAQIGDEE